VLDCGAMMPAAVYRRTIGASLARIWENVLDWEHLPWLHRSSFLAIDLVHADRDGWEAWVSLPPRAAPGRARVAVALHRPALFYWTRTLEGAGAGTEIRTTLAPRTPAATDITVEFFVPGLAAERAAQVGAFYVALYTQLWDEDEGMMTRRQAVLDDARPDAAAAGVDRVDLGPVDGLRARLPLVVALGARSIALADVDGAIVPYVATCPHLGGPLAAATVAGGVVTCPWHGYRFDVRTGASADGRTLRLPAAPRLVIDSAGNATLRADPGK
jgi:nitrite reductase/ring-hydroxylating ferredoxin subunit